jgi:hypothetical protein
MSRATAVHVLAAAALAGAAALVAAGCSGDDGEPATAARPAAPSCPQAWRPGWQRLANRIDAPVFCPTWMPNPLTAEIGGEWDNGVSVGRDRSYLVSFLWHEAGNDVHVNLRGYPGSTRIPRCEDVQTVKGKTHRRPVPCFADPQGTRTIGRVRATLYTANRDIDQWHLLYAWGHGGTLYTLSEHVAPPFSLGRVQRNLERMLRTLALVQPST